MRNPVIWVLAAGAVVAVVIAVAALWGGDDGGEPVAADEWAENVCGAVDTWRGELESVAGDIGSPSEADAAVDRAVQATETMVEGIDDAGVPDTEEGEQAANDVSVWAERALDDLEEAQDSGEVQDATGAISAAVVGGVQTLARVAELDPALGVAVRQSSTCQQLREEAGR